LIFPYFLTSSPPPFFQQHPNLQMKQSAQTLYRQVPVKNIDLTDTSYALNPFPTEPDSELVDSITALGILHPPLLLEYRKDTFIVLSGRRRLHAVQTVDANNDLSITALIVQYSVQPFQHDPQFFKILLGHQLVGSRLSVIEQAVFLQKAIDFLEREEVIALLPMLGLKAKSHVPEQLISLLGLDVSVQVGLHRGIISQRSGKKLARFSQEDQKKIAEIIDEYQLGGSKQQKLIDQVFQLSKRERISAEKLLGRWCEREKDKQLNGPQRIASLLKWLDQECQPRLSQADAKFRQFRSQLKLPSGVRVEHSPAFEEERVTLSMDFSSREELACVWPKIEALFL
jgi:hypothetical protein